MNDQLLCGFALGSVGIATLASGITWLATGFFVAAIPFLAVGALFLLERVRARQHEPAGSSH
jgi:hypothetical protein